MYWCWNRSILGEPSQYHGYWCPSSSCRQGISSHTIDSAVYMGPYLPWGIISSTCAISVLRNYSKHKYIFVLPKINSAQDLKSYVVFFRGHPLVQAGRAEDKVWTQRTHQGTTRWVQFHCSTENVIHIDVLVQNCSNSSVLAMELLQFCTKSLTCNGKFITF